MFSLTIFCYEERRCILSAISTYVVTIRIRALVTAVAFPHSSLVWMKFARVQVEEMIFEVILDLF